jgi:uncharacterized protein (DUF4415 family)
MLLLCGGNDPIFQFFGVTALIKTPRRPLNPLDAAEALFKPAKKPSAPAVERPAVPHSKEMVSIRLDSDILEFFQNEGPGWQDRINDALRDVVKDRR